MTRLHDVDITRIVGLGLMIGLVAWSVAFFQESVEAIEVDSAVGSDPSADRSLARGSERDDGKQPEFLAFHAGFKPGIYDISDLPGSRDRDYQIRSSGSSDSRSTGESTASPSDPAPGVLANYVPEEQGSLAPGLYSTSFGVEQCSFELHRVMRTRVEQVIGREYLAEGRLLVTINEIEPDRFVSTPSCGDWVPWSPVTEPLAVAGNGDYWIGDLEHGTWTVPTGCIWEKVVGFRGASLWDVEESARGPVELVVDEDTLGIRLRGCRQPATLQSDA